MLPRIDNYLAGSANFGQNWRQLWRKRCEWGRHLPCYGVLVLGRCGPVEIYYLRTVS